MPDAEGRAGMLRQYQPRPPPKRLLGGNAPPRVSTRPATAPIAPQSTSFHQPAALPISRSLVSDGLPIVSCEGGPSAWYGGLATAPADCHDLQ